MLKLTVLTQLLINLQKVQEKPMSEEPNPKKATPHDHKLFEDQFSLALDRWSLYGF